MFSISVIRRRTSRILEMAAISRQPPSAGLLLRNGRLDGVIHAMHANSGIIAGFRDTQD
jgi:hypothetical protein